MGIAVKHEVPTSICEFKGCGEVSSRTFAAVGTIRLCEQHFHECLKAAADLAGEVRSAMGPHLAEFTHKWRRERNLDEGLTTEDMTKEQLSELLLAVHAELKRAVKEELPRYLRGKLKNNE
jgi:Arc/MetJ family transcription regulator